jgi:uncharacterized protein YecT (DUF1311 family)
MSTPRLSLLSPGALALGLLLAACGGRTDRSPKEVLASDSSLAADLKQASDTSAYSEAADIAMADTAGALPPDAGALPPAVTMRVPDTRGPVPGSTPVPRSAPPASPSSTPAAVRTPSPVAPLPAPRTAERRPSPAPSQPPIDARVADASYGGAGGAAGTLGEACTSPVNTDQRRCLMGYLARSDVQLDHNYQTLIAALRDQAGTPPGAREPEPVHQLRVAQRAWLVYRDTECRRRNRGQEGPLWAPLRARCLGEFSGRRAAELADATRRLQGR